MSDYFIYYASSNIVGAIIFGIMLAHDRFSIDRQEKQLKYDQTLIAFMLYFVSDSIWCAVDSGLVEKTLFRVAITTFTNFILSTAIMFTWLMYVLTVEKIEKRNRPVVKFAILFPFMISTIVLILIYVLNPSLLISDELKSTALFDVFISGVPYIYILAVIIYVIKAAKKEDDPIEKKKHLYIGFFPIMVVVGGLCQMLFMPTLPIFCFAGTILMLIFHIKSTDDQISTDPLTKLNNRGQLARYVAQENNLRIDGRSTYVIMMDINDFKKINDTYGHAEGDRALVIVAQALVQSIRSSNIPMFLGRYGGDEFILIVHPAKYDELKILVEDIRENVRERCKREERPYIVSIGIGYDELLKEPDTYQKCVQRADSKLYLDKEYCKINGKSTICK
ncbi:MAG: GGDEF domain-containing protein [Lachnospiraceae bacterium]|nr:GGDEF domain-containing protein [Lachnospiraceae bacterium]